MSLPAEADDKIGGPFSNIKENVQSSKREETFFYEVMYT